jgi:conjugal transfer/type IV secretion protein DotA/TraY
LIKWITSILILVLLPSLTYGELNFTPSSNDLSLNYLRALFGNIEGVLLSEGTQILGRIFNIFNSACLSVGGMVLLYILITTTINTAQSGEVMGRNPGKTWLPIRAVMGVALLFPKGSGYCTLQAIIMWVVIQGIGLANSVWSEALDYIKQGGGLVETKVASSSNLHSDATGIQLTSKEYLKAAACVKGIQKYLEDQVESEKEALEDVLDTVLAAEQAGLPNPDPSGRTAAQIQDEIDALPEIPDFENTIDFPFDGLDNGSDAVVKFPGAFTNQYYTDAYEGICGQVRITSAGSDEDAANNIKMLANESLYAAMSSIADSYINDNDFDKVTGEYNSMGLAILEYYYAMKAGEQYFRPKNSSPKTDFISGAEKEGWITAGAYYYKLVQIKNNEANDTIQYKEVSALAQQGTITEPTGYTDDTKGVLLAEEKWLGPSGDFAKNIKTVIFDSGNKLLEYMDDDANPDDDNEDDGALERYKDLAPSNQDLTDPDNETKTKFYATIGAYGAAMIIAVGSAISAANVAAGVSAAVAMAAFSSKVFIGFEEMFSGAESPIVSLALVGSGLMDMGTAAWIIGAIGVFVGTLAGSALAGWNPAPFAFIAGSAFVAPMLTLFLGIMVTSGALLFIYIPLIPAIVFLFATVGWFFNVLEAMAAAPLICLGLMHPEGHDVWGKAESAMMLVLNVFLRPALLIVGFLVASMLSYVGIWLVNKGFLAVMFEAVSTPKAIGTGVVFAMPIIIGVYGMICMWMLQAVFELVPKLPDEILKWIGGQTTSYSQGTAAKAAQLQGAVSGAAGQMSGAMSRSMEGGMSQKAKDLKEASDAQQKNDDTTVSGDGGKNDVHMGNDSPGVSSGSKGNDQSSSSTNTSTSEKTAKESKDE